MNTLVQRVLGTGYGRASRFHDGNNRFMGVGQLRHLPASVGMKVASRLIGSHLRLPGWPYPAVQAIERLVQPDWRVLEFGSGWSTLWLADRCAETVSIESSPVWAAFVQRKSESCRGKVQVIQRELEDYPDTAGFADASFDLCVVDGLCRHDCIENAMRVIRPGGYLYLDNSESGSDGLVYQDGGRQAVQRMVRDTARDTGGELREYRGLIIGEVFAGGGLLMRKGGN
ncbi:methyltransferase domain-containing protein [Emcibacter sp. SYSU 3D8]|uniref:class I SAM-dependent methyltransferase n=1 Tax=Emcibacter sp. SYSU 3D8 TaxID=3133969 RepID=UPI0031FEC079